MEEAWPRPLLDAATSATLPSSPRSTRPGPLADPGERPCLAAVAAGLQPDDQPAPDRDDVVGPVVGLLPPVLVDPRRPHHQHHPVTGRDDLLKLGPRPAAGLAAERLLQLPAAMADLRLRARQLRVAVGPVDLRVHEVHHPRDIAAVVGPEGLTYDPLVLVAHRSSLTTVVPPLVPWGRRPSLWPKMPGTARQTAFRKGEHGMNATHWAGRPINGTAAIPVSRVGEQSRCQEVGRVG